MPRSLCCSISWRICRMTAWNPKFSISNLGTTQREQESRGRVCGVHDQRQRRTSLCSGSRQRAAEPRQFTESAAMIPTIGESPSSPRQLQTSQVELSELVVSEGAGGLLVVRVPRATHPPYGTSSGMFNNESARTASRWIPTRSSGIRSRSARSTGAGYRLQAFASRISGCHRGSAGAVVSGAR
jgi:hypothetical protein